MGSHEFALFRAAEAAGFDVKYGNQQVMLFSDTVKRRKIGGWNTIDRHWYVSKVAAGDRADLMRRHGFRWMTRSDGHCWWQLDGIESADAFKAVAEALAGVAFACHDRPDCIQ